MVKQEELFEGIKNGDFRILARALTLVENDIDPAATLLKSLSINNKLPVVGITGPPGAGKSTLVNAITGLLTGKGLKVAILAIDPTSPFNFGSLLGDRIRMAGQFNHPRVFIRSLATRGALGGISAKTIEMVDVLKAANFDIILVETVGVGQSEVEIAGLASQTVVVLVPESGDEIQNIKSGLMEVAQAFVVNKADRDGAGAFANRLKKLIGEQHQSVPVFKTIADKNEGINDLCEWLLTNHGSEGKRKQWLIAEQAFRLIQHRRMQDVDRIQLQSEVAKALSTADFNLYRFVENWIKDS